MPEVTSNPQRLDPIANSNPKWSFASRGGPPKVRDQKHVSFSLAIFYTLELILCFLFKENFFYKSVLVKNETRQRLKWKRLALKNADKCRLY